MEKETRRNITLGAIVLTGIALFVSAIFLIGSHNYLFNSGIRVSASFRDLSGLQPGDNVTYAGVRVGTVKGLSFVNDTTVWVDLRIDPDMQPVIHKDAQAEILSEGLIGSKTLAIRAGDGHNTSPIADGDVLESKDPINKSDIMDDLVASNQNVVILTQQLAEITAKLNQEGGLFSELAGDSTLKNDVEVTIHKLNENLDAMRNNFLMRGYFKKKADQAGKGPADKEDKRNR